MSDEPLLRVEAVEKSFQVPSGRLRALRGVSLDVAEGRTVGVVGESGSGKSTLARCVLGLVRPESGHIWFEGVDMARASRTAIRRKRRDIQLVFQDPDAALNPRMTVLRNIIDPLIVQGVGGARDRRRRAAELMDRMGLPAIYSQAFPYELSGGQQQRVMIARAMALSPKLLVCDEIVSALDVSVQAQILALLQDLQRDQHLSYLFISHNLAAVGYVSDAIAVMYLGEVVEMGETDAILENPQHPYTVALFRSVLDLPEMGAERPKIFTLPGEVPSPVNPPAGCSFYSRCPRGQDICRTEAPPIVAVTGGHFARCHFPEGEAS